MSPHSQILARGMGQAESSLRSNTFVGRTKPLTPREWEVANLAVHQIAVIAELLAISESTVKSHLKSICDKTGCESKAQVVAFAVRAEREGVAA